MGRAVISLTLALLSAPRPRIALCCQAPRWLTLCLVHCKSLSCRRFMKLYSSGEMHNAVCTAVPDTACLAINRHTDETFFDPIDLSAALYTKVGQKPLPGFGGATQIRSSQDDLVYIIPPCLQPQTSHHQSITPPQHPSTSHLRLPFTINLHPSDQSLTSNPTLSR